jgi:hypothetical protein
MIPLPLRTLRCYRFYLLYLKFEKFEPLEKLRNKKTQRKSPRCATRLEHLPGILMDLRRMN